MYFLSLVSKETLSQPSTVHLYKTPFSFQIAEECSYNGSQCFFCLFSSPEVTLSHLNFPEIRVYKHRDFCPFAEKLQAENSSCSFLFYEMKGGRHLLVGVNE